MPTHGVPGCSPAAVTPRPAPAPRPAATSSRRGPTRASSRPTPSRTTVNTPRASANTAGPLPRGAPTSATTSGATRLQAKSVPTARSATTPAATRRTVPGRGAARAVTAPRGGRPGVRPHPAGGPRSGGDADLPAVPARRALATGPDVLVEDLRRQEDRAAGVGDVHHTADAALDRRGAEDQVGLLAGVAPLLQVADGVQAGVAVGQRRVHVDVRVVAVVDRDADEREELGVARLHPARHEDRVGGDAVGLHAALDEVDVEVDEAAHLDGAAEVDLAVPLAEVQVPTGEQGAIDVHRVEHPAAAGEVLDVVVAPVLPGRDGAGEIGRASCRERV